MGFPMLTPLTGDLHLGHASLQPAFTQGLRLPVGVRRNPLGNLIFTKNSHFNYSKVLNKCI